MKNFLKILSVLIIGLFSPMSAFSQCTGWWMGNICYLYDKNENVVTGTAVGKKTFRIEKTHKGKLKGKIEVWNELKPGEKYLLFPRKLNKTDEKYTVLFCSGGKKLRDAFYELKYLEDFPEKKGLSRVFGFIASDLKGNKPLSTKIRIVGENQTFETSSDKNGFYEIYGVPAGEFYFEPVLPPNRQLLFDKNPGNKKLSFKIYENGKTCREINLIHGPNNFLRGRVFASNGEQIRDLWALNFRLETVSEKDFFSLNDYLKKTIDNFEITGLPPGQYRFSINPFHRSYYYRTKGLPVPPLYFPGTEKKENSTVFTINETGNFENLDFQIPAEYPLKLVSGRVTFSDEKTAGEVHVRLYEPDGTVVLWTKTDPEGNFQILVRAGTVGYLKAGFTLRSYDVENCNYDKEQGKFVSSYSSYFFESNEINLRVKDNISNQNPQFPVGFCQLVK